MEVARHGKNVAPSSGMQVPDHVGALVPGGAKHDHRRLLVRHYVVGAASILQVID